MATAVEVLKHETFQSPIYESINVKFGKGDYVMHFSNPAKLGEDCISGGAPTWR